LAFAIASAATGTPAYATSRNLAAPAHATAPVPAIDISSDSGLRFGTMIAADTASRTVHASGEITDGTMLPIGFRGAGPAQFTISYDRGENDSRPISVVLQVMVASMTPVVQDGVTGMLSDFETDIPGVFRLVPGRPATTTLSNCTTRVCSVTFHVGARLDVQHGGGGGAVNIAPQITATVLAVRR
jgi:hypothetical protein